MTVEQAIKLLMKEDPKATLVIDYESFTSSRQCPIGVGKLYKDGQFLHEPGELTSVERAELQQVVAIYG